MVGTDGRQSEFQIMNKGGAKEHKQGKTKSKTKQNHNQHKMQESRAGMLAQQLRALIALEDKPGSIPSTPMVSHNNL